MSINNRIISIINLPHGDEEYLIRLYDIQVIISGATTAERFQNIAQYQAQLAQARTAIQLQNETIQKHDQVQPSEQETNTKAIDNTNAHLHQWKRERFKERGKQDKEEPEEQQLQGRPLEISHIIDIIV